MRFASGCSLLFFACLSSLSADDLTAEPQQLEFANQQFTCRFVAGNEQEQLAEYTLADETIEDWQKLVAVRNYPLAKATPLQAANMVVAALQAANPLAKHQLLDKVDHSEALLDFITWPEDGSYAEFNVFRYVKRPDKQGLVCYQFAFRFNGKSDEAAEKFKKARQIWLDTMIEVNWDVTFSQK